MKRIRILLVEDNRLLREGLAVMLGEQPDISLVASLSTPDVTDRLRRLKPTIILLDIGLRTRQGIQVVESFKRTSPSTKIIVMDFKNIL